MTRLSHFDGLRGLLALWVFLQHWLQVSGFRGSEDGAIIRLFTSGGYAVHVFVMLSGFVIAYLLYETKESYWDYITRRFFRLYPVFLACLLVSIFTFRLPLAINGMLPVPQWGSYPEVLAIVQDVERNFSLHVGIHLTMLHGLFPDQILPSSATALLPPAWSISLEWQFYLIAPLFLSYLLRGTQYRCLLVLLIVGLMYFGSTMGTWFPGGVLGNHLHLFFVGAAGFALYNAFDMKSGVVAGNILVASAVGLAITPAFANKWPLIPYVIWFYVVGITLLSGSDRNMLAVAGAWFLNLPVCQYLGKISYSMYLWHWPILLVLQYLILKSVSIDARTEMVLILGIFALPVTLLISTLSYFYIEEPGIRLGKKIVASRNRVIA